VRNFISCIQFPFAERNVLIQIFDLCLNPKKIPPTVFVYCQQHDIPYCRIRRDAPPILATPSSLLKRRQRIPTIVPSYRPVLRRHQLIVESSGLLVTVVVPPVALLPLVVVMPPVEVVVHSVALLPLAAVVPRRRAARRRRVPPVAIVVLP